MYLLAFYIPDENLEDIKQALFQAGAGLLGNYSHCCWQVQGQGQFKPLAGSKPYLGQQEVLETVAEWKVDIVIDDQRLDAVMQAFFAAHPYEEPAYQLIQCIDYPKSND